MELVNEIIGYFVAAIVASGGIGAFIGKIGNKKNNKQLIQDTLSEIDTKQNQAIEEINTKIDLMHSDIKDSRFMRSFRTETLNLLTEFIDDKKLANSEIENALFAGKDNFNSLIESIVNSDFSLNKSQVQKISRNLLKPIKKALEKENISEKYLFELKQYLLSETQLFAHEYQKLSKLHNGIRRSKLKEEAHKTFKNIVNKTIDSYHISLTKIA